MDRIARTCLGHAKLSLRSSICSRSLILRPHGQRLGFSLRSRVASGRNSLLLFGHSMRISVSTPTVSRLVKTKDDDPLHYAARLIARIANVSETRNRDTHVFALLLSGAWGDTARLLLPTYSVRLPSRDAAALRCVPSCFRAINFGRAMRALLKQVGVVCYRGNEPHWMYQPRPRSQETLAVRAPRLLDHYVSLSGSKVVRWEEILQPSGLCDVRSSMFLRPYSPQRKSLESIRLRRIAGGIRAAAEQRGIFHLWWHPHNFGANTKENLDFLRSVLEVFASCRQAHGMRSLSMLDVAALVTKVDRLETPDAYSNEPSAWEQAL